MNGPGPDEWYATRRAVLAALAGTAGAGATATARGQGSAPGPDEWPTFGHDAANTGANAGATPPTAGLTTRWQLDVKAPVTSQPAVVGGTVYVTAADGRAFAVDRSGELRVFGLGGGEADRERTPTPAVRDGSLYVGGADGVVYAIDLASGDRAWTREVGAPVVGSAAVAGDVLYVGDAGGGLSALDLVDGAERWGRDGTGRVLASPAVADGTVYAGTAGEGAVVARDAGSGDEEWRRSLSASVAAAPVVDADHVYAVAPGDGVYALDRTNGAVAWRRDVAGPGPTTGASRVADPPVRSPAVADGTLYLDTADFGAGRGVTALDAASGEVRWTHGTATPTTGGPTVGGDGVFVGTEGGAVYGIGPDGTRRLRHEVGSTVTAVVPAGDRRVYAATRAGVVYALAETGPLGGLLPAALRAPARRYWQEVALGAGGLLGLAALYGVAGRLRGGRREGDRPPADAATGGATDPGDEGAAAPPPGRGAGTPDGPDGSPGRGAGTPDGPDGSPGGGSRSDDVAAGGSGSTPADGTATPTQGYPSAPGSDPHDSGGAGGPGAGPAEGSTGAGTPDSPSLDLSGVEYDDFAVGDRIGAGGSAEVHRASVVVDGVERTVALKTPLLSDYGTVDRAFFESFVEEAELWSGIDDHPHVVSVHGWGTTPHPWIALEYMDAGNLGGVAGDLTDRQVAVHVETVCEGVHHAHRHGITHGDLKPENVLFRRLDAGGGPADDGLAAKVSDWGLAQVLLEHSSTVEGMTPSYAAPEQFDPEAHGGTDDRTDVYQLGAVAYEAFTGHLPFERETQAATINAVLTETPTPVSEYRSDLPVALDGVLATALATEKADRHETALHLRDAIRQVRREL